MVETQASRTRIEMGRVIRRGSGLRSFMRSSSWSRSLRASEEGPGWDYRPLSVPIEKGIEPGSVPRRGN